MNHHREGRSPGAKDRPIDPGFVREIERQPAAGELGLGQIDFPRPQMFAEAGEIHVDRLSLMDVDRREIVDALEERQQDIAARGGERFATGVRLAQVEGAAAQGADRRQGMDQVAKIAAVEERLQVADELSRETPCLQRKRGCEPHRLNPRERREGLADKGSHLFEIDALEILKDRAREMVGRGVAADSESALCFLHDTFQFAAGILPL
jgi:hypothetical protein